jgi:hypothetical protein
MAKRQANPIGPSVFIQTTMGRGAGQSRKALPTSATFLFTSILWASLLLVLLMESAFGFQPSNPGRPPLLFARDTESVATSTRSRYYASTYKREQPPRMVATTNEVMASGGRSPAAVGQWEEVEGNFVLRPSVEDGPPRALGMSSMM